MPKMPFQVPMFQMKNHSELSTASHTETLELPLRGYVLAYTTPCRAGGAATAALALTKPVRRC